MSRHSPFPLSRSVSVLALAFMAACSSDMSTGPAVPVLGQITVDASAAFTYLHLADTAQVVTMANPEATGAWDMAFFATTVTLDGGQAGPGGDEGYCLCGNAAATTAQLQAMTPDNQLAAFTAVTSADIPAAGQFRADSLAPAIGGWYTGTAGPSAAVATDRAWLTLEGTGPTAVLGKFHVLSMQNPTAASPGTLTIEFAVQPSAGAAFGSVQNLSLNTAAGPVYVDLTTGAVTDASNWDIEVVGWTIRVNSGVSGGGTFKVLVDTSTPFANIDAAYAATAPAQAFRGDSYEGVFAASPWYRYNITGADNQIWPVFNVYLVKRGTAVYKVQLTGYYAADGTPRHIGVRYERLTN